MTAAMVLTNLLYVVGPIVAATFMSLLVLLHHRRPKSMEAGIESFSRELRALAPTESKQPVSGEAMAASRDVEEQSG